MENDKRLYGDYSVDMIRLKVEKIPKKLFSSFSKKYQDDPNVEGWQTLNFKDYRYQMRFTDQQLTGKIDSSFWLGYLHNAKTDSHKFDYGDLVIEFNPNKCSANTYLGKVIDIFFSYTKNIYIQSCDIAIDFHNLKIEDISFSKAGRKRVLDYYENGSQTHYIGKGDGRVKIYDKAKEQKIEDKDWTRYEVSFTVKKSLLEVLKDDSKLDEIFAKNYPAVWTNQIDLSDIKLTGTDEGLLFAVMNGFPIEKLSRDKRKKISEIIEAKKEKTLAIEPSKLKETLFTFLQSEFKIQNKAVESSDVKKIFRDLKEQSYQ
jgi:hypothetical protein